MSPTPAQRAQAARITAQIAALASTGFALPGTLTDRMTRCGHPGCRCHADPPRLHGPYHQWTRKRDGKTSTRILSDEQLADYDSIAAAAGRVPSLDVLVNNAGVSSGDPVQVTDEDPGTFRRIYETNVFGVVAVTNAFLPALRRSARPRIVNISNGTASIAASAGQAEGVIAFASRPTGSMGAYRSSKTALNELTVLYANALADDGFKVNALAPGLRRTDLNGPARTSPQAGDPAEGAAGAVRLALLPDDGPSGGFFSWDGSPVPW